MKRLGPSGILVVTVLILTALRFDYAAVGTLPSENVSRMSSFALALACILWIMADAQTRRQTPCYDFGFLVAVFFPISLFWYVFWSRGWRGFVTLGAVLGLLLLPALAEVVAGVMRTGLA